MSLFAVLAIPICHIFHLYVLYKYLIPREKYKRSLIFCLAAVFCLHIITRICLLSDIPWIVEYNVAKLLTILTVFMLVFWAGYCIYGGWAQIGLYLIVTEVIFSVFERLYWQIWGYLTHATAEAITLRSQMLTFDFSTGLEFITESAVAAFFLIPARKLKRYPVGQVKAVKIAVIVYLVLGCLSPATRTGFKEGNWLSLYSVLAVDSVMFFFAVMTILQRMERESKNLLQLRQYTFAAQAEALGTQRQKVRRFRHDVKRHLDAMSYLIQQKPELESDPSFLRYRKELEPYADAFRQGYYCDSDELNASITQMEKYCSEHRIPIAIKMRRLQLSGWSREEQLQFGTLLYNLLISFDGEQIAGMQISGDNVQGQNILRLEEKYRPELLLAESGKEVINHKARAQKLYIEDLEKILSRHKGSCLKLETERGREYAFLWENSI